MKPKLPSPNHKYIKVNATSSMKKGVIITVLAIIGLVSLFRRAQASSPDSGPDTFFQNAKATPTTSFSQLERATIKDIPVFVLRPYSKPPKGIFFGAHGCGHSATDWFPSLPKCLDCIGLPEEQAIVDLMVNQYDFLVVIVSSVNRKRKCWEEDDAPRVASVFQALHQELGPNLPVIAFGASSGGWFVGNHLPALLPGQLTGFISQIMAPRPPPSYQGTAVYITMNRDKRTDSAVQGIVQALQRLLVPTKHIRLEPLPIQDDFFSQRITTITREQSKAMVTALRDAGYLDATTHGLKDDPRRSNWREILRPLVSKEEDTLAADASPISEVMNVAWAKHELTRDGVAEAVDFILEQQEQVA